MEDLDRVIAAYSRADTATAHDWFTLLCQVQADLAAAGDYTVADLAARLAELDRSATDALLLVLADVSNPLELLAEAGRYRPDELIAHYEVLLAQAWNTFLAANGPAWDGTEQNWTVFRGWFAAAAVDAGVGYAAETFLGYVEGSPNKVAAFAEYGLAVHTAAPAPGPTAAANGQAAADDEDGFAEGDLGALFAEPELDDIAADLAKLDDAEMAALAAEISAELSEHQDH